MLEGHLGPRADQIAAQRLWRDLIATCDRAAQAASGPDDDPILGLNTDTLGYIVLELGLGLLALDFEKWQLLANLRSIIQEVEKDELAVVNAGLRLPEAGSSSWIRHLSGLDKAHPRMTEEQIAMLRSLRKHSLGLRGRASCQEPRLPRGTP